MREYATTFSQTSCNPLDYPCLRLLTDESVTQLLLSYLFFNKNQTVPVSLNDDSANSFQDIYAYTSSMHTIEAIKSSVESIIIQNHLKLNTTLQCLYHVHFTTKTIQTHYYQFNQSQKYPQQPYSSSLHLKTFIIYSFYSAYFSLHL